MIWGENKEVRASSSKIERFVIEEVLNPREDEVPLSQLVGFVFEAKSLHMFFDSVNLRLYKSLSPTGRWTGDN